MLTRTLVSLFTDRLAALRTDDRGAVSVGWLALGVLLGAALVIFAIIKFLIPGE